MRNHRKVVLFAAAAAVGLGAAKAKGDKIYWSGAGFTNNWSQPLNWDSGYEPGSTDQADFGGYTSFRSEPNLDSDQTIKDVFVDGPASSGNYVFTGSNTTLTVSDDFQLTQPNPVQDIATVSTGLTIDPMSLLVEQNSYLTISGGGNVNATYFQMSNSVAGPNPTTVIGSGSALSIGTQGANILAGELQLNSGGQLNIAPGATLGVSGSSSGLNLLTDWSVPVGATVNVVGGATMQTKGQSIVGSAGSGTLLVDGAGSSASASGSSFWGLGLPSSANVTISNSAIATYDSGLSVGLGGGSATVNINTGGELFVLNGLSVAGGTLGSTITVNNGTMVIGNGTNDFTDFSGGATLNLQTGGVLLSYGNATFSAGSTLNISGGTLSALGTAQFDSAGSTTLSSGGLNLNNGGTFEAGSTFNWSGGILSIGSGQTLTFTGGTGTLGVGTGLSNGATVHMTNGAVINGAYLDIGSTLDGGANGTLLIDGAGTKYTGSGAYTDLGLNAGDSGTMTISSSGAASFNAGLHLAGNGGKALLTLSSSGVLNVVGLISGNSAAGSAATINISGGTINSTGTSVFQNGSAVTLSSGGLLLGDNGTFSTGANFNWTGGTLSIASGKTLTFDGGTGTIAVGTGLSNGATIHITDAAHVTTSFYLDFGSTGDSGATGDGGANGTLLIDGAGSSYTATDTYTDFGPYNGDFGTLTISNSGAATFGGLHLAGGGGKALLTLSSGSVTVGTLQVGSGVATSVATINLTGGTLNVTGAGSFLNGSTVSLSGGGVGSFTAAVTFLGGTTNNQLNIATLSTATFGGGLNVGSTTFTLNGGTLANNGTAQFNSGALVNLSAGSLSLGGNATFLTGSTVNWSGGSLSIATGKTLQIDGVGSLSLLGPIINGSTLSVGTGGLVATPSVTVGPGFGTGGGTGTILVTGTNARLTANTNFGASNVGNGGTLIVSNGGVATFSATLGGAGLNDANGGGFIQAGPNGGTITGGTLTLNSGSATTHMNVIGGTVNFTGAATFSGNAVVSYQSGSFNIGSTLTTANSSATAISSGAVLRTHGLSMNDTSTMNLNGGFIDDYSGGTPISTIRGYILAGRNGGLGGLWKGAGINSSTAAASPSTYAVGYAEASAIGSPATFMGQSIDNTTVVARLAYLGDANLDGKVNAQDFDLLAANYGKSGGTAWTQGDFNYDGVTNVIDFNMLASNFNATPLNAPALGTLVPEPATVALLAAMGTLLRRRRA